MSGSEFEIVRLGQVEAFGNYRYEVWQNGRLLAEIEHLYNGDEYFMRKPSGMWEETPRSLDGGGPAPLRLSEPGLRDFKRLTGK